jgi:prophage regulatory protein
MLRHVKLTPRSRDSGKLIETDQSIGAGRAKSSQSTKRQSADTQFVASKTGSGGNLPELVPNPLPFRRTIRRAELRQIVPLGDTTIYEMERRGEFPQRFYLTSRCVVWDLAEVEAWVEARRQAGNATQMKRARSPDVRRRRLRPVKAARVS